MEPLVLKIQSKIYESRGLKIILDFDLLKCMKSKQKDSRKLLKKI